MQISAISYWKLSSNLKKYYQLFIVSVPVDACVIVGYIAYFFFLRSFKEDHKIGLERTPSKG